ncbi:hypothetical protein D3Z39_06500 [Anaerotruncus colihominis]|uniref:Uncharacterized protein n=1 Tax=Anaerotruncus colihominis TaxID=169435 RepID=A0A845RHW5_9FIRM|nr:hypothetical protein [Anaerotruncus colihominis]
MHHLIIDMLHDTTERIFCKALDLKTGGAPFKWTTRRTSMIYRLRIAIYKSLAIRALPGADFSVIEPPWRLTTCLTKSCKRANVKSV